MAATLRLNRVRRDPGTGRIYLRLTNKREYEFNDLEHLRRFAQEIEQEELILRLFVLWWLTRDSSGQTAANVEGKAFTLDLSLANAVAVG